MLLCNLRMLLNLKRIDECVGVEIVCTGSFLPHMEQYCNLCELLHPQIWLTHIRHTELPNPAGGGDLLLIEPEEGDLLLLCLCVAGGSC